MKNKVMDVYLIAGQSNAAGYTVYDENILKKLCGPYAEGFANVLYSGRAEYTVNVNTPQVSTGANEVEGWVPVKVGFGFAADRIGPELGMAAYLSEHYYNEKNSDKTAGIIKFAHGGTSLLNDKSGENAASGNWMPPSYAETLGIGNYAESKLDGGLYKELIKRVKSGVDKLKTLGYNDFNIKGLFWMQGECDRNDPCEYTKAFEFFIKDLRRDLSAAVGRDLSNLPVIIGEISRTSGSADVNAVAVNEAFIAVQRALAQKLDNVYCIASGKLDVNLLIDGVNKPTQDGWHWATEEMFTLGELAGKCIVDNILG